MRALAIGLLLFAACGNSHSATPDGAGSGGPDAADGPEAVPQCTVIDQPANPFASGADFAAADPGTLAGWHPTGRWFLTGTPVDEISSYRLDQLGAHVIVDNDTANPGTFTDDEIFQRSASNDGGNVTVVAKRVSNLRANGHARAEYASCDGDRCLVCTAILLRATHNAGEGEGDHISLLGELRGADWGPGYTFNVRVVGTLAYLIRQDGLHIIETADPAHPVELGWYHRPTAGYSNDVKLVQAGAKRYAILADSPVDIVDVTDAAAPTLVSTIAEEAHTVFLEARGGVTYAYFGNYNATCPIYDVTDPVHAQKLGNFATSGYLVHDLSVKDGIAYLNAWNAGFQVVDYTTPSAPHLVGKWANTPTRTSHSNWTTVAGGRHIALHGEENYGAHLDIVDVDPASPQFMQSLATWKTRDWISIHNLMAFGEKAYFTYYQDGVRVMDLSDPAHPQQVGYYNTWDPDAAYTTNFFFESAVGLDVDLARKLIFVADSPRGLLILKDETP